MSFRFLKACTFMCGLERGAHVGPHFFNVLIWWCLLIQCLGAKQGIPPGIARPGNHVYPFPGSAAQGHLAVLVAYVLYSGGVHDVNTIQCCVSVKPLLGWWLGGWNSCFDCFCLS